MLHNIYCATQGGGVGERERMGVLIVKVSVQIFQSNPLVHS